VAALMADEYVRVCPVCETENPPTLARCRCGASLTGVDFSLRAAPAPAETPEETPAAPPQAAAPPPFPAICPYPDCAQPNPPGATRCVYCDRPLDVKAPTPAPSADLPTPAGARALPAALREHYRVLDVLPASGSEADLLVVEDTRSRERRVAKLYRKGIEPDARLLAIVAASVGDHLVRVLAHGVSEGVAYELLEYIPGGTLADLMRSGPLSRDDVRRIASEIADSLNGIHVHHILHRDLKPENVLVRSREPLELALTDFGISSISEATQRFTSVARTTRYAAPEALTGVIDEKSDWWSLGMIVLEAATGRHPFAGLSEHVMNHHLATRPIDVRGVYDDDLRLLCRGLLTRDPKRRWGAAEVARWLARDPSLEAPNDAESAAGAARPYRIGTAECTTAAELAVALAKNWTAGAKDLARGQIGNWVEHELHDYDLARKLHDIREHRDSSDDARLLRFVLAIVPDLPPVWQGRAIGDDAILAAARAATAGDKAAEAWLDSLAQERVLPMFERNPELRAIDERWRSSWAYFLAVWNGAREAEAAWRRQPKPVAGAGSAEVVSYDDVMYGAQLRLAPPPQRFMNGPLLLAQADAQYAAALKDEVTAALGDVTGFCDWFEKVWQKAQADAVGVLVAQRLLRHARDDAAKERTRQGVSEEARLRIIAEARDALRVEIDSLLEIAPHDDVDLGRSTVKALIDALEPLQKACHRATALAYPQPECVKLRQAAQSLSAHALALSEALGRLEETQAMNALLFQPQRIAIPIIFTAAIAVRSRWAGLALILATLLFALFRASVTYKARGDARDRLRAVRHRAEALRRHGTS
jgi:hypothetical protein